MKCPECGEELQLGVRICPNCEYELTDSEIAQAGSITPVSTVSAPVTSSAPVKPERPNTKAPQRPVAPAKPAQPEVNMPESIMSHGDVSVQSNHAEDNSVHNDNSVQNNVTDNSQTVNNTNQTVNNNTTILIMGGGNAPLPDGVDESTAEAVRQAQMQMTAQQNKKGVGSIAAGQAYAPSRSGTGARKWIGIVLAAAVIGGGIYFFVGKKSVTAPASKPAVEAVPAQQQAAPKAVTKSEGSAAKSTATKSPSNSAATKAATQSASAKPAATTPDAPKDAHYEAGMKHFNAGEGLEAVREFKASGSKQSLQMLGQIYESGCGSVEANAMMARKYYKEAEKKK